ncbi:MAG: redox-regulated ATPase YchF [Nitrososphaerota archaeon]|nr:redox-regulated ATPase YchF [Nitrososphaerota archaeon]
MELAGIVGKPNVGKSTMFAAMTLAPVEIASYPFTTIRPNRGITYLRINCVCRDLGVRDNPKNSKCVDGVRLIPIEIIDCPGIIRQAHEGRGLGLKFLDEIRQASALIIVVDAAGATDPDGNQIKPGTGNPVEDARLVEEEIDHWLCDLLIEDWKRIIRVVESKVGRLEEELAKKFSGLRINEALIQAVIQELDLNPTRPSRWSTEGLFKFIRRLRERSKPTIIAANKIDLPEAEDGIKQLEKAGYRVVPVSAEAERILRLAAEKRIIRYLPGDPDFEIIDDSKLTSNQKKALELIREKVLGRWKSTGVQEVINKAYFELLNYIPVYPVENPEKLTDHDGNVLPDVYILPNGSTPRDLAYAIHTDLGNTFLYAIDARRKIRLGEDYRLKWGDVISIVAAGKRA